MKSSKYLGTLLWKYYKGRDHPFKLRIFFAFNRFLDAIGCRITIPYHHNQLLSVSLSDYVDRTIFLKGVYEEEIYEALTKFSITDEVLWDIGGHIGSFAIKALADPNIKQVYAFEPNPGTFKVLTKNKRLNDNQDRLKIYNFGLGENKTNTPYLSVKSGNSGGGRFLDGDNENTMMLPIDTMDNLVFNMELRPPTLIKIDVEGFEVNVFRGAKKTFDYYPPKAIIFESETINGQLKSKEIRDFFEHYRYNLTMVECKDEQGGPYTNFLAVKD